MGLRCDQDGQYRASQRDGAGGKAFCVDGEGRRLPWSETEALLTDSQCQSTCWGCNQPRPWGEGTCSPGLPGKGRDVWAAFVPGFLFWRYLSYIG